MTTSPPQLSPDPRQRSLLARAFSATNGVLFLICLMYALTYIDRINVNTAGPVFQRELHLKAAHLGWVFSAFGWAYLVLQVSGGWLSDRFGARRTLAVCALVWALATIMMGTAGGLGGLIVARVVLGLGEGATFPVATRAMSDWMPASLRGFSQGITHAFSRLGNALTPPLMAWLIWKTSWRGSFLVLGFVSMLWAIAWWLYFRDDPTQHPGIAAWELQKLPGAGVRISKKKEPVPWKQLVQRMWPVTAVYFCYGWTLWLYLTWLPSFFKNAYSLDLKKSALFSAGVFFAGVVGDTAGGVTSDYILLKTGDRNQARRNMIVIGFLCSLLFMLPVLLSHNLVIVSICLSCAFFFLELTIGPFWAIPMDLAPRFSGSASGLMNVGSAFAAAVSPLVAGYVIDWTQNYTLPFIGSVGLLVLGSVVAFWMKPNEPLAGAIETAGVPAHK